MCMCAYMHVCLQVRVVLEGVDKFNNLFGTVMFTEGDKLANLGEAIMQVCVCVCLVAVRGQGRRRG